MLNRLNATEVLACIQLAIEKQTGLRCYDAVPQNANSPFSFVELTNLRRADTKTSFGDLFYVSIHVISIPEDGRTNLFDVIQKVTEAMTSNVILDAPYHAVLQIDNGVQRILKDETNENHAIIDYSILVTYKFETK